MAGLVQMSVKSENTAFPPTGKTFVFFTQSGKYCRRNESFCAFHIHDFLVVQTEKCYRPTTIITLFIYRPGINVGIIISNQ